MRSAPARATAFTSSPRRAKSADRMLGAMRYATFARVYNEPMAEQKQYDVAVSAQTQYLADQSDEANGRYVFAYTITIRNAGSIPVQLISRHWIITDSQGLVQEGRGLGVGCAQAPPQLCPCPPVKAPERAQYIEWSFSALPGWDHLPLEPSLRAFVAGCPRAAGALINACATASTVAPGDEAAARQFFESAFSAYALLSSETGDTGTVTGYYEPIVRGSRTPSAFNRFPIYGLPDDLLVVDLATVAPDTRNVRLRGRLDGRRVVPYYSRAEIMARTAALGDG